MKPRRYEVATNNYDIGDCLVKRRYDGLIYEDWLSEKLKDGSWSSFMVEEINPHKDAAIHKMVEALKLRCMHDDDCADSTEKFQSHEMCECGAIVVKKALEAWRQANE